MKKNSKPKSFTRVTSDFGKKINMLGQGLKEGVFEKNSNNAVPIKDNIMVYSLKSAIGD